MLLRTLTHFTALVIAHANALHGASAANLGNVANAGGSASEYWKVVRQDFLGINEATAKIRLRLNPLETQAQDVLTEIDGLEQLLAPGQMMDYVKINSLEKRLVSLAQLLLKTEWTRVQKGEATYKVARFAALAICIACVVALVVVSVGKLAGI